MVEFILRLSSTICLSFVNSVAVDSSMSEIDPRNRYSLPPSSSSSSSSLNGSESGSDPHGSTKYSGHNQKIHYNGSMWPGNTASGTLMLRTPLFLLGWPPLPLVGSSKARIHYFLSALMTLLPLPLLLLSLMMATNHALEWCNNCDSAGAFLFLGEFLSTLMKLGFNLIFLFCPRSCHGRGQGEPQKHGAKENGWGGFLWLQNTMHLQLL